MIYALETRLVLRDDETGKAKKFVDMRLPDLKFGDVEEVAQHVYRTFMGHQPKTAIAWCRAIRTIGPRLKRDAMHAADLEKAKDLVRAKVSLLEKTAR